MRALAELEFHAECLSRDRPPSGVPGRVSLRPAHEARIRRSVDSTGADSYFQRVSFHWERESPTSFLTQDAYTRSIRKVGIPETKLCGKFSVDLGIPPLALEIRNLSGVEARKFQILGLWIGRIIAVASSPGGACSAQRSAPSSFGP